MSSGHVFYWILDRIATIIYARGISCQRKSTNIKRTNKIKPALAALNAVAVHPYLGCTTLEVIFRSHTFHGKKNRPALWFSCMAHAQIVSISPIAKKKYRIARVGPFTIF